MRLSRLRRKPEPEKKNLNSSLRVIVGLRNPGSEYEGTRHNVGFEVVARLLARTGADLTRAPSRLRSMVATGGLGDDRVLYLVPSTFMNESGSAVRGVLSYYKVPSSSVLVVHDDIDLPLGRLRLQVGGGSGGHNGIRSLERSLGTKEFSRLKVGVGRPPGVMDPADFVLRRFTKKERPEVDLMVEDAADVAELWLTDEARAQERAALRGRETPAQD